MKFLPGILGLLAATLGAYNLVASQFGGQAGSGAAGLVLGAFLLAADRRL